MNRFSSDITAADARAIAAWHMAHEDWSWGNRHDQIAFHLFWLAANIEARTK